MPQVSLKEYAYKITQHIESSKIEEAIAHCRHILSQYPKYLPAYRLLAHACLEKGDFAHANHFFQCVLSGDPQDADAWMNLAILSDDLGELEQATWLMERAFEVKPGNAQIRAHLRQLYSRRDGVERTRIKLSKGALAQLYAAGGFYKRAIEELESLLETSPTLPPLHIAYLEVALAESLWYTEGMSPMADRICQSLVEKFPNCLQANLIMGQIRWSAGMEQEARPYIEIARMLDPEGAFAYQMFGDQSPLPRTPVLLNYLEYQSTAARTQQPEVAVPETKDTSWLDDVGKIPQAPGLAPAPEAASEAPEWLKEWQRGETPAVPAVEESESALPYGETQPRTATEKTEPPEWLTDALAESEAEEKIPDWLQQLSVQEITEPVADQEELDLPDWLQEISPEVSTAVPEDIAPPPLPKAADEETLLPDWLQELGAEEKEDIVTQEVPPEPAIEEELPDWLQALGAEEEEEVTAAKELPAEPVPEEGLPDWLQELRTERGEDVEVVASRPAEEALAEPSEEEVLPDWLQDLGAEEEEEVTTAEELPAEPATEEELPDWLLQLRVEHGAEDIEAMAVEPVEEALAEPLEEEELPDWLQELDAEEEEVTAVEELPAEPVAEEELPDWLQELRTERGAEDAEAVAVEPAEEALAEPLEEEALPDWLQKLGAEEEEATAVEEFPAEPVAEEELPDWLQELRTERGAEGTEAVAVEPAEEALAEPLEEEALPDWLQKLGTGEEEEVAIIEELPAEPVAEEELPDWLQEVRTERDVDVEAVASEPAGDALAEPSEVEGLPDWLQELDLEQEEEEITVIHELTAAEPVIEEELPDWLLDLRPGGEEPSVEDSEQVVSILQEGGFPAIGETARVDTVMPDKPGWLLELESDLEKPPVEPETRAQPLAEVAHRVPVLEMPPQVEGRPEWLVELESEISGIQPPPIAESVTVQAETAPSVIGQLPALDEETAGITERVISPEAAEPATRPEQAQETFTVEQTEIDVGEFEVEESIPEWLTELETRIASQTLAPVAEGESGPEESSEVTAIEAQDALEWLPETEEGALSEVTVEEMPDWLDRIHTAGELPIPDRTLEAAAAQESPIAEEMDWLNELEQMPETLLAQDEQRPESQEVEVAPVEEALQAPELESPPTLPVAVELSHAQRPEPEAEVGVYEGFLDRDTPEQRLALARALLRDGLLDESATEYEQLATMPAIATTLIDDLEQATGTHPEHAALHRVLGDAYMKAGQLQKALMAYKESLNRL
jgi:tetratricopeptide (TPR) repeat protein